MGYAEKRRAILLSALTEGERRAVEVYGLRPTDYYENSKGEFYRASLRAANRFGMRVDSVHAIWQRRVHRQLLDRLFPIITERKEH